MAEPGSSEWDEAAAAATGDIGPWSEAWRPDPELGAAFVDLIATLRRLQDLAAGSRPIGTEGSCHGSSLRPPQQNPDLAIVIQRCRGDILRSEEQASPIRHDRLGVNIWGGHDVCVYSRALQRIDPGASR